MKTATLLLTALLAFPPGGDREKGLQLYREGHFREAAAAFEAAIKSEGDSAELQFNLALARWRAGDLPDAETAVEKYVAMAGDARTDLHAGVLGAVRYDEAKLLEAKADALIAGGGAPPAQAAPPQLQPGQAAPAQAEDPLPLLEQAVQKATQAKDHFVRGAVAASSPELLRNTERTLRLLDELQKKIDELKKQREEQKKDDQQKPDDKKDDKKDEEKKQDEKKDEPKKDDEKKSEDKKPDEKKPEEQKPDEKQQGKPDEKGEGESKPEPKPEPKPDEPQGEPKTEPQQGQPQEGKGDEPKQPEPKQGEEQKPGKPEAAQPRHDAPGEMQQGKELTPEQAQRLLDELQKLDAQLKAFRARAKSGRRPVERDW